MTNHREESPTGSAAMRRRRAAGAVRVLAGLGAALLIAGCSAGQPGEVNGDPAGQTSGSPARPAGTTTVTVATSPAPEQAQLTEVDPADFAAPRNPGAYAWNYSTGGPNVGLCVADQDGVTCTGRPAPEVPDLTEHFPGRPGAIELGAVGLRYTFVEGVPPVSARLDTGQAVQIGDLRCAKPDASTLECRTGANSFTVSGPEQAITTTGSVLAETDYANHPSAGTREPSARSGARDQPNAQPAEFIGATGLVSGVRTSSGRLVTASAPPCDGRGILIVESYIESPDPQSGIAALLDRHPGAEFMTPGQCPSLRAEVGGARVYPVYIDHGHNTAALCRDKQARGGNARVLSPTAGYTDPC